MRRFAKPLYGLTPVPRVRIPPSPPDFFNPNHLHRISFLLDRSVGSLFLAFWCPVGVINRGDGCRDVVFQLFHRVLHVISGGFDVVRCRRVDIRVSKNALPLDILAISKDKKRLLVKKKKKGRASNAVIGQTLRYMSFVQEMLAEKDQSVQGIIIALEDDPRIRRALAMVSNIQFYRNQINFKLVKA